MKAPTFIQSCLITDDDIGSIRELIEQYPS